MPPDYEPPPVQYPQYPQEAYQSTVISRVFEAYKVNPILAGMIILLLLILGAVGWYATRNDDRMYGYIALRDRREHDLWDRLVEMSLKCRDKEADPASNYPLPNFPPLTMGGPAFKPAPKNK